MKLIDVLEKTWKSGIDLQSNYFRSHPKLVALAASLGYISTIYPDGDYGGTWRITPSGCTQLYSERDIADELKDTQCDTCLPCINTTTDVRDFNDTHGFTLTESSTDF
jgi:hypothetical protein